MQPTHRASSRSISRVRGALQRWQFEALRMGGLVFPLKVIGIGVNVVRVHLAFAIAVKADFIFQVPGS